MEKRILIFLTILGLTFQVFAQSTPKTNQRVLFLGNSYTYVNNLPIIIKYIATIEGDTLYTQENLIGGYTLKGHSTNQTSLAKIMQGNWDAVVLQEQSQLPSFPIEEVENEVFPAARFLDSIIHVYSPCAKTIFYMTWGRQFGDNSNCSFWPPVCTYEGMDSLLNLRYKMMGQLNNAIVSPVGLVWKEIRQSNPEIVLYQSDESHPDMAGSYAAACSFYTTLFHKNPLDISYNYELDTAITNPIKRACKKHIYDSISIWDKSLKSEAGFSFQLSGKTVSFQNSSINVNKYNWDFGDGSYDTLENPIHTYEKNGIYKIKLKAFKCNNISTDSANVVVMASGLSDSESQQSNFAIYPNPAEKNFDILFKDKLPKVITIYNLFGEEIIHLEKQFIKKELTFENMQPGFYTISIQEESGHILTNRIIIK